MTEEQGQVTEDKKIKPQIKLDNRELTKTSFWVGQVFMILATIIGVYLAAQEGLNQAITFDILTNKQNNYFLRRSLYDEVQDNTKILEEYANMLVTKPPYDIKNHSPALGKFIWENMKFSQFTLETPTELLSNVRRYYLNVDAIIAKIESRTIGPRFGAGELTKLNDEIIKKTLPELQKSYQLLAKELEQAGIPVTSPGSDSKPAATVSAVAAQ